MDPDETNTDRAKIIEVSRRLIASMIDCDLAGLDEILDPGFTLTRIAGYV